MVGNPGVGTSTLLNSILRHPHFKSGYSLHRVDTGTGLTYQPDIKTIYGINYLDTPELFDIERRKAAANAITMSLKQNGIYLVYFVCTLDHGRLRPDDVTLLRLILDSAKELTTYYVIVNQVSRALKRRLDKTGLLDILVRGGISPEKLPNDVLVVERFDEIEDKTNTFIPNCKDLVDFVNASTGVRIHSTEVTQLRVDDFEKMREELMTRISEIEQQREQENVQYQNQMKILMLERDKERKEELRLRDEERRQIKEMDYQHQLNALAKKLREVEAKLLRVQVDERQRRAVPRYGNFF